jgi:hypothetical protein
MIRRRFSLDGVSGPDEMGRTIVPVVLLDTDLMSPEYSFYAKERRAICWGAQGGDPAEYTYFQLRNPPGSNHLTIVKSIWGFVGAYVLPVEAPMGLYRYDAVVGVPAPGICVTDSRWGEEAAVPAGLGTATTLAWGVSTGAAILGTLHFTLPFTEFFEPTGETYRYNVWWKGDYVLHPGRGIVLWTQAINRNVDLNIEFRERMLTRWEK